VYYLINLSSTVSTDNDSDSLEVVAQTESAVESPPSKQYILTNEDSHFQMQSLDVAFCIERFGQSFFIWDPDRSLTLEAVINFYRNRQMSVYGPAPPDLGLWFPSKTQQEALSDDGVPCIVGLTVLNCQAANVIKGFNNRIWSRYKRLFHGAPAKYERYKVTSTSDPDKYSTFLTSHQFRREGAWCELNGKIDLIGILLSDSNMAAKISAVTRIIARTSPKSLEIWLWRFSMERSYSMIPGMHPALGDLVKHPRDQPHKMNT